MDERVSQGFRSERRAKSKGDGKIRREFSGEEALAIKPLTDPAILCEVEATNKKPRSCVADAWRVRFDPFDHLDREASV